MEYAIVDAKSASILVEIINRQMKEGWRPQGGVSVSISHDAHGGSYQVYAQAMIKESE